MPRSASHAELLAFQALAVLGGQDGALERLVAASGIAPGELAARIEERPVQAAILEFLLMNEDLLLAFCETTSIDPKDVHRAQHLLEG